MPEGNPSFTILLYAMIIGHSCSGGYKFG